MTMKLFIWWEPFSKPYAGGCIIVLAESEEAAVEQVMNAVAERAARNEGQAGPPRLPLDPPDCVFDYPSAHFYEWSE